MRDEESGKKILCDTFVIAGYYRQKRSLIFLRKSYLELLSVTINAIGVPILTFRIFWDILDDIRKDGICKNPLICNHSGVCETERTRRHRIIPLFLFMTLE